MLSGNRDKKLVLALRMDVKGRQIPANPFSSSVQEALYVQELGRDDCFGAQWMSNKDLPLPQRSHDGAGF